MSKPQWSRERPTEAGFYWWYHQPTSTLKVVEVTFHGDFAVDRWSYLAWTEGWWLKMEVPEVPSD